jgi:hypothetical protein
MRQLNYPPADVDAEMTRLNEEGKELLKIILSQGSPNYKLIETYEKKFEQYSKLAAFKKYRVWDYGEVR